MLEHSQLSDQSNRTVARSQCECVCVCVLQRQRLCVKTFNVAGPTLHRKAPLFTVHRIMKKDAVLCCIEAIYQSIQYVQNSQIAKNKYEEQSQTNYLSVRLNLSEGKS